MGEQVTEDTVIVDSTCNVCVSNTGQTILKFRNVSYTDGVWGHAASFWLWRPDVRYASFAPARSQDQHVNKTKKGGWGGEGRREFDQRFLFWQRGHTCHQLAFAFCRWSPRRFSAPAARVWRGCSARCWTLCPPTAVCWGTSPVPEPGESQAQSVLCTRCVAGLDTKQIFFVAVVCSALFIWVG